MAVVAFVCHYHDVETVRFDENPLASQVILFRFEFERGLFAVQTRDHDPGTDRFGIDGLVVTVGVETVFGRNTVFEDGNLDSEVAVTKHVLSYAHTRHSRVRAGWVLVGQAHPFSQTFSRDFRVREF